MTRTRKILIQLAAGLLLSTAVGSAYAQDAAAKTETTAKPAVKSDPNKVLATVNGVKLTEGEVDQASSDLDPQFSRLPDDQRRLAALAALVDIKVLAAAAKADKLDDDAAFKQRLEFLKDRALHNEYFQTAIVDKITDAEVRARYDTEIAAMPAKNEVRARHILVKTEDEAKAIIKKLEGGAKFEDLAKESSTDGSAAQGGDLGYFGEGMMVPEFEKAAFALDVGGYTKEPVKSQFGYHVIKVEDKRQQQPPAFDQVKDQVRSIVIREKYIEMIKKLREATKISYEDEAVAKAMKEAADAQDAAAKAPQ
ncbi:peptidylprolyl isomerase [Pseudochrobactrum sp. MP213Fo]|uniref:peptidylprolyl isomerase n=1 Tax=Pseudochrobactrum sp. MP213Fo TaxID=3022250 RepID=UPI003B9FC380